MKTETRQFKARIDSAVDSHWLSVSYDSAKLINQVRSGFDMPFNLPLFVGGFGCFLIATVVEIRTEMVTQSGVDL